MPKLLPLNAEYAIKSLSEEGYSQRMIQKALEKQGYKVSNSSIHRVIHDQGNKRSARVHGLPVPANNYPYVKRTKEAISKIKKESEKENPISQRSMAKIIQSSTRTAGRIIHNNLGKNTKRKTRVHKLNVTQIQNRKTNSRKLYEGHLAGDKYEYMVTIDEAWIKLDYCNGKRKICYVNDGENVPNDWIYEEAENFAPKIMVAGILTGRGVLPLMKVPEKIKINADVYIDYILRPMVEIELPKLYPGELSKIFIHHDKAPSHTSKKVAIYAKEIKDKYGITIIDNNEIPVKSPDISPLDFFGFGYLKSSLFHYKALTINRLWKNAKEVWGNIKTETVVQVFKNWKKRCRSVDYNMGKQIERTSHNKIFIL